MVFINLLQQSHLFSLAARFFRPLERQMSIILGATKKGAGTMEIIDTVGGTMTIPAQIDRSTPVDQERCQHNQRRRWGNKTGSFMTCNDCQRVWKRTSAAGADEQWEIRREVPRTTSSAVPKATGVPQSPQPVAEAVQAPSATPPSTPWQRRAPLMSKAVAAAAAAGYPPMGQQAQSQSSSSSSAPSASLRPSGQERLPLLEVVIASSDEDERRSEAMSTTDQ